MQLQLGIFLFLENSEPKLMCNSLGPLFRSFRRLTLFFKTDSLTFNKLKIMFLFIFVSLLICALVVFQVADFFCVSFCILLGMNCYIFLHVVLQLQLSTD